MRKWSFFVFVAFLIGIIGCGGGGSGTPSTTTTTTTTGTTRNAFGVNIPNMPGLLDTYFEPTQGRQNTSYFTVISDLYYEDVNGITTNSENTQIPQITLDLSSVSQNPLNDPLDVNVPDPVSLRPAGSSSAGICLFSISTRVRTRLQIPGYQLALSNVINATVLQGRTTAIQLYLNDGEFDWKQTPPAFNKTEFMAENVNPSTGLIQGFLSDYLSIDISGVAKKPVMSNGQTAGRVFISGDEFALAKTTPTSAGLISKS